MYTITSAAIAANVVADGPDGPIHFQIRLVWHRNPPPDFIFRAMIESGGIDYTIREWASRPSAPKFIAVPLDKAPILGFGESGEVEFQRADVEAKIRASRMAKRKASRARGRK